MRLQAWKRAIEKTRRVCLDILFSLALCFIILYAICAAILFIPFLIVLSVFFAGVAGLLKLGGEWINGFVKIYNSRFGNIRITLGSAERGIGWKFNLFRAKKKETKRTTINNEEGRENNDCEHQYLN